VSERFAKRRVRFLRLFWQSLGPPDDLNHAGRCISAFDGFGSASGSSHWDFWSIMQNKVYYEWMTWPMMEEIDAVWPRLPLRSNARVV
jgi:hypothetical protein